MPFRHEFKLQLSKPVCLQCVKSVRIRSYFGPHFTVFGLNRESPYSVRIRENADQNNSEYRHFSRSVVCLFFLICSLTVLLLKIVSLFTLFKIVGSFRTSIAKLIGNITVNVKVWRYSEKLPCKSLLHKKWSFPLRISLVNVTKSARNCGFGHTCWRKP